MTGFFFKHMEIYHVRLWSKAIASRKSWSMRQSELGCHLIDQSADSAGYGGVIFLALEK